MSNEATFGQATHSLTVIGQQDPTAEHLRVLHDGYLADLVRAIKLGTIPARFEFRKVLGLTPVDIWGTIRLGTGPKTADDFRAALKKGGCSVSSWGDDILGKFASTAGDIEIEVDIIVPSIAEMGFPKGATRRDIYQRAFDLGWECCPDELAPQLLLQSGGKLEEGERFFIGMEPIAGSDGNLSLFSVRRGGGDLWLSADYGHPDGLWSSGNRWVFRLCRK